MKLSARFIPRLKSRVFSGNLYKKFFMIVEIMDIAISSHIIESHMH